MGYLAQFNSISKCTGAMAVIMHPDFKNNAYNRTQTERYYEKCESVKGTFTISICP